MAARTSMGVGLGVTVGLLSAATLALFVMTFLFMAQKQNAEKQLVDLQEKTKEIATDSERNTDNLRRLINEAKAQQKSLASYLVEQTQVLGEKTAGSSRETPKSLNDTITKRLDGSNSASLMAFVDSLQGQITQLQQQVQQADAARQRALIDYQNEVQLTQQQKAEFDSRVAALTGDIGRYKDAADQLRAQINEQLANLQSVIASNKAASEDQIADLNNQLTRSRDELLRSQEKIREQQERLVGQTFKPGDEATLVDGEIIGTNADNTVFINRGRNQKVVLGLNFEVYSNASAIRPDASGNYPAGKATLEVIKTDENSSVARVVRNPRGNPVVKGDMIANIIYDPKKTYKFMVYGNFDTNRDGIFTPEEQAGVRALIQEWGGVVVDSLGGDVDFLVLGTKPVAPPAPPPDAPAEIVRRYLDERRKLTEYEEVVKQATATSIPVLNQNRLYTLTGH